MNREIIDVPLLLSRAMTMDWRPDWRGQPSAVGLDGSEQVVYNRFPRFIGSPQIAVRPEALGHWRALILRGEGRVNAYRFRMPTFKTRGAVSWRDDWRAYEAGLYVEPRPQILCPAGATAGATSIVVDETSAPRPIPVGCYLSHDDWPFAVVGRSGSGAATTLEVKMLRRAIPPGGQIDLVARGLFLATSDAMGFPEYGVERVARPQLELQEWITR